MSPWLYQELSIVNNIQIKELKYYRRNLILEHSKEIKLYQNLNVKYEADLRKLIKLKGETIAIKEMRSLACFYIKGFKNAAKVRGTIHTLLSYDKLEEILLECLKNEEDR